MRKLLTIMRIASILTYMIIRLALNSTIIFMELYEAKLKIKFKTRIYEWKLSRKLEEYGIPREVSKRISKNIYKREVEALNNLLSLKGIMEIMRKQTHI
ncbi:MAG: hypothetical protein NDF57_06375 [archaeon GBS-70-058]|nr:hypothetical protein [Candidatus Culexarchaeum nevadense]